MKAKLKALVKKEKHEARRNDPDASLKIENYPKVRRFSGYTQHSVLASLKNLRIQPQVAESGPAIHYSTI